jgi:branched-chain amino acid transport system ATP-binding protein
MADMSESILKATNLGISFGGLRALHNFEADIHKGELVGLIGPNGAGKTTVFNLFTGVYKPTEGAFYLNGELMNGKKTHEIVASGIARTFQNIRLFKKMTVMENVLIAFTKDIRYGLPGATFRSTSFFREEQEIREKAMSLLTVFNLQDKADWSACNLPYGQQRKLEIARALATNAKMLLLDEPAAGMNPTETAELLACINTIRRKFDITILLIEHDMSLVMNVCERIIVIDYGEIIAQGLPEEISHNPRVIAAYLGE